MVASARVVAPETFQAAQDRHFSTADAAHFVWTTQDEGFAPVEDDLLCARLATLPFPCLELGCGEGTNLTRLARCGAPVGIDRYLDKTRFAARAVPTARLAVADATALPFASGSFSSVLVRDVLHHLPEPQRALAEVMRVLRPSGELLLFEPNGRNPLIALQGRMIAAEAGLRDFTPASVLRLVESLGFAAARMEMAQAFPLRRLVLHYRFGLPALGRLAPTRAALVGLERLAARLLPRERWSYTVIRARRA